MRATDRHNTETAMIFVFFYTGPLIVAGISYPAKLVWDRLALPKFGMQMICRGALGLLGLASYGYLQSVVAKRINKETAVWLVLLTAMQFHIPFYLTRPLPNVIASVLTNVGLAIWLKGRQSERALAILVFAAVVFRCDTILLASLVGLNMLWNHNIKFFVGIAVGFCSLVAGLLLSVPIDSIFWGRWLWPEGEVLYFNTILNKSHEWGVSPWNWYFKSALPRSLHVAYPLAFIGALVDKRVRPSFFVALGFVLLYSNLGHKELRFLFPVLPLWNISAAAAISKLRQKRQTAPQNRWYFWHLVWLALTAAFVAGLGTVFIAAAASRLNYPGGVALMRLHELGKHELLHDTASLQKNISVHIGVYPAMTGVSRFGEAGIPWIYSKAESLDDNDLITAGFEYLLSDKPSIVGYTLVEVVEGYAGLRFDRGGKQLVENLKDWTNGNLPVRILTSPQVFILRRNY